MGTFGAKTGARAFVDGAWWMAGELAALAVATLSIIKLTTPQPAFLRPLTAEYLQSTFTSTTHADIYRPYA